MADNPKVLNSRHVYAGRLFDLKVDEIEFKDGVVAQREIIRHPGAVAMVAIDPEGRVLLVSQYRHPAGARMLEIPAGTLEADEDPEEAVRREMQEEVGYLPNSIESIGGFYVAPGYCDEYIRLYVCTDLEPSEAEADEDEDIEVEELTPDEALAKVEDGSISDAKSIIALTRWAQREGRLPPPA
jgi:ADP-ribose pyrophosphatase